MHFPMMKKSLLILVAALAAPASAAVRVECLTTARSVSPQVQALLIRAAVDSDTRLSSVEIDMREDGAVEEYSRLNRTIIAAEALERVRGESFRKFNITEWEDEIYLLLPPNVTALVGRTARAYVALRSPDDEALRRFALRCAVRR